MSEQNIELVRRGYQAFAAGDTETVMALFDDDVEWVQPGESTISGTYRGKAGVAEMLMRMAEKSLIVTPRRFLSDGDAVVVLSESSIGGERGGSAEVHTIRDGKVLKVEVFGDTALMERHYGSKRVAAG